MCLLTCINADFLSNASWEPNPGGWIEQAVSIVGKRFLKPIIRQNLVNWTSSPSWSYPAEHISSSHTVSSRDRISRVRIGPLGAGFPPQHLRLVFVLGDWLWNVYHFMSPSSSRLACCSPAQANDHGLSSMQLENLWVDSIYSRGHWRRRGLTNMNIAWTAALLTEFYDALSSISHISSRKMCWYSAQHPVRFVALQSQTWQICYPHLEPKSGLSSTCAWQGHDYYHR